MPNALFFNVPGYGHVNPSLPLVAELAQRGHRITYFITPKYRASVEAAGAIFQPYSSIDDDYFESLGLHGGVPQRVASEMMKTSEGILPELVETGRGLAPDYVMFDGMCPWGYYAARALGVPAVTSFALMPPGSMPPAKLVKMLPILLPMMLRDFSRGMETNRRSYALGAKYDAPPLLGQSILQAQGDICFSYTSSYFQPYGRAVSERIHFIGWTVNEAAEDGSFSFDSVGERRLIYVSLGTLNSDNPAFFRACIEAFGGGDEYVIMSTGEHIAPESFGALPQNIAIYSWVPQISILKRASLFITHGGLNSIHDGLYFGVPLLLVPQQGEQMLNALRAAELGAGLILKKRQAKAEAIRASAARLMNEPGFRTEAARIGETLREAGGAKRAADELEAILQTRASAAPSPA